MLGARKKNPPSIIEEQEKLKRIESARNAEASLRIEGLFLREESKKILEDWINGLISDQERNRLIRNLT